MARTIRMIRCGALALLACASVAQAAEAPRAPAAILVALYDTIKLLGETTGRVEDMIAVEAAAAEDVRRYIASGATDGLLAADKSEQTPLATAAYLGYPNVVAALLESKLVRSQLNDANAMGMTPWIASTLSMKQSLWACDPAKFDNSLALVPMLVIQGYYLANPEQPYRKARALLEEAGARRDPAGAKQAWNSACPGQAAEMKAKVEDSIELQATLQEQGLSTLRAQLAAVLKKIQAKRE